MDAETQEQCAKLVEQMLEESPWRDQMSARAALIIAARAIRRGRHLTAHEKFANLKAAFDGDVDGPAR